MVASVRLPYSVFFVFARSMNFILLLNTLFLKPGQCVDFFSGFWVIYCCSPRLIRPTSGQALVSPLEISLKETPTSDAGTSMKLIDNFKKILSFLCLFGLLQCFTHLFNGVSHLRDDSLRVHKQWELLITSLSLSMLHKIYHKSNDWFFF